MKKITKVNIVRKLNKFLPLPFFVLALISLSAFKPTFVNAADCGGPYPPMPQKVWAKPGPNAGEVTVYWDQVPYANRYAIAYGTQSGNYMYGADNIGNENSTWYTVKYLNPGTKYYFVLAAARDCTSSPFSVEFSAWATGGTAAMIPQVSSARVGTAVPAVVSGQTTLSARPGPGVGQVTLNWWHKEDVDNYHLVYGTKKGSYEYGALNIGKVTSFTVSYLVPGRGYYFALVPVKGDRALYTSDAVWSTAARPVTVVETTQPIIVPIYLPVVPQEPQTMLEEQQPVIEEGGGPPTIIEEVPVVESVQGAATQQYQPVIEEQEPEYSYDDLYDDSDTTSQESQPQYPYDD